MKKPELKQLKKTIEKPEKRKILKRRLIAGTIAAATSLSLLVNTTIDNPKDLFTGVSDPAAIVQVVDLDGSGDDGSGGDDETAPEERKKGIRARLREQLLKLPLAIRVLICVPLWGIGWGILALGEVIVGNLGQPVLQVLMRLLMEAAVLLLVIGAAAKTVAPELPLKKIFRRKTIIAVLLAAVILEASLLGIRLFLPEGDRTADLLEDVGQLLLVGASVGFVALPFWRNSKKKQKETQTIPVVLTGQKNTESGKIDIQL